MNQEAVEEIVIQREMAANDFFHDFLLLLEEAGRRPFPLTKTANLKLSDIHYLGEHFAQEIYRRNGFGELVRHIQSEREVRPLRRIRRLAQHMRLTDIHKGKLTLSIRGKAFLAGTPLTTQFEQLTLWYLQRYDWADWYTYRSELAKALQQQQRFLWDYFLHRQDTTIDFHQFLLSLRHYFALDDLVRDPSPFHDDVRWAVEQILIKDLRLFGLLAVESETSWGWRHEELIYAFQPTALGIHIFQLALRTQA
jgi:hypothetical protein